MILHEESFGNLNKHTGLAASIAHSSNDGNQSISQLRDNNNIVLIGQNVASNEIFLAHHLQEVSGGIGSSFKALVCLRGLGVTTMPIQLDPQLMNDGIELGCPSIEDLWNAGSASTFVSLPALSGKRRRKANFKALLTAPPFASKTLADSNASDPEEASFLVLSACESYLNSVKDELNTNAIKSALSHALSFFWAAADKLMTKTPCEVPSNGLILSWADCLRSSKIRPASLPAPDLTEVEGPSSAAWGLMAQSMSDAKQALQDQVEDKRTERNEKKDK